MRGTATEDTATEDTVTETATTRDVTEAREMRTGRRTLVNVIERETAMVVVERNLTEDAPTTTITDVGTDVAAAMKKLRIDEERKKVIDGDVASSVTASALLNGGRLPLPMQSLSHRESAKPAGGMFTHPATSSTRLCRPNRQVVLVHNACLIDR